MKRLQDLDFADRRVLVRVDFNVPLDGDTITNDRRIREALPTLEHILQQGGIVLLMSHLGRPKGKLVPEMSLRPVQHALAELLQREVFFLKDPTSEEAKSFMADMHAGDVVLMENLRFHPEEEAGDEAFAAQLADLGDVYINDAFGTAHRAHASTTVVAKHFQHKAPGLLMEAELKNGQKILDNPQGPFVLITGGAKVSDKIGILENLLDRVDTVIIGGGMAYTFLKAQGHEVGNSLVEAERLELAADLLKRAEAAGKTILLPEDSLVADAFKADANTKAVPSAQIEAGWMGLDIGPRALAAAREHLLKAKTILWNGPMGVFEMEPFSKGTFGMAQHVAEATRAGAYSLIGGGDSAAAVEKAGLAAQVSYVSTGGGALLELLEGKILPGVAALRG